MKSFKVVILVTVFIVFSWMIKGVLLWIKCRKKVNVHDVSNDDVKALERSKADYANSANHKDENTNISSENSDTRSKNSRKSAPKLDHQLMQSRIRRFYHDVEEILEALEHKGEHIERNSAENLDSRSDDEQDDVRTKREKTQNDRKTKLQKAIKCGDAEELASAIEWALLDDCKHFLQDELYQAQAKLKELQNIERIRQNLYMMRPGLISELRSYTNPPKVVVDVMMCVYLLLGETKAHLKTWSSIQGLLCTNGRNKLKRLIERHQSRDIAIGHLDDVKIILSKYDFQSVYLASEGAAAFFLWIEEVIDDFEKQKTEKPDHLTNDSK